MYVLARQIAETVDLIITWFDDDLDTLLHNWSFDLQDGELIRNRKPPAWVQV